MTTTILNPGPSLELLDQPLKEVRAAYPPKPYQSVKEQLIAKGFIIKTKQSKKKEDK